MPPARLTDEVLLFAEANPNASRGEWIAFAQRHGEESYVQGYIRGREYADREPDPEPDPDVIMRTIAPGWENSPPVSLDVDFDARVPDEPVGHGKLPEFVIQRLVNEHREEDE